jgi:hypothetical protein
MVMAITVITDVMLEELNAITDAVTDVVVWIWWMKLE